MRRASILLVLAVLSSCSDPTRPPDLPPLTPFALTGVVGSVDGSAVADAYVEVLESVSLGRIGAGRTDQGGRFRFQGVKGPVLLRVSKSGYFFESRRVDVASDVSTDFTIRKLDSTAALPLGTVLHSTVERDFPPCNLEVYWNETAPCRRFLFQAPATGTLSIKLSWPGAGELDLVLFSLGSNEMANLWGSAWWGSPTVLNGGVLAGHSYEVRVSSFDGAQAFDVIASLTPTTF